MRGFLTTILVLVVILGIGIYYWTRDGADLDDEQVFCTLDAKICPDGSYVGRVAPSCEFAACSDISIAPGAMMEDGTVSASTSLETQVGY
jgi:hypothetical protein